LNSREGTKQLTAPTILSSMLAASLATLQPLAAGLTSGGKEKTLSHQAKRRFLFLK